MNWKKILIREWYQPQFNKAESMVSYYRNVVAYGESVGIETLSGRRKGTVLYAQTALEYWVEKQEKFRFKLEDNERRGK
ncbi:MAG: hypothetical protein H8D35_07485 [Nitrosopumilus sp.]|nr:hypothetical protein [Nitrosopumilus sp.]